MEKKQKVINCFKGIDNNQHYKFIMFNFIDLYSQISKEFFTDALIWQENHIPLP